MGFVYQMLYGPTKANEFLDTKILPKITNLINENGFKNNYLCVGLLPKCLSDMRNF